MTGDFHWVKAEELLMQATEHAEKFDMTWPMHAEFYDRLLAAAAVHASLAQSAAIYGWHIERFRPTADSPNIDPANAERNGRK